MTDKINDSKNNNNDFEIKEHVPNSSLLES